MSGMEWCSQIYYVAKNKTDVKGHWCHGCYTDCKQESMEFDGQQVKKGELEKKKNDEEVEESWVNCDSCGAWVHQICALFNKGENSEGVKYHCPHCLLQGRNPLYYRHMLFQPRGVSWHYCCYLEHVIGPLLDVMGIKLVGIVLQKPYIRILATHRYACHL